MKIVCYIVHEGNLKSFKVDNLPARVSKPKIMGVKIKNGEEMIDAAIEMVDGVMVVSPKVVKFEPKDGDILFIKSSCDNIIIYKESDYGICRYVNFSDNRYLYTDNTIVCDKDDVKVIRPATEEEKKKLFDKLEEEGFEWDAEKKEVVKLKWKPKVGDTYYRPDFNRCMFMCYEGRCRYDTMRYIKDCIEKGWCFKTKEECQEFCNRLNDAINSVKL